MEKAGKPWKGLDGRGLGGQAGMGPVYRQFGVSLVDFGPGLRGPCGIPIHKVIWRAVAVSNTALHYVWVVKPCRNSDKWKNS